MFPNTTALDSIRGVIVPRTGIRPGWLLVAAAYLLPTLATGAGCWLALTVVARVLGVLITSGPVH